MNKKKYFCNEDRRTAYLKPSEYEQLKDKLETLNYQGKGFLSKFLVDLATKNFILIVGDEDPIQKLANSLKNK